MLSLLLLLPLVAFMPKIMANQFVQPALSVLPVHTKFYGPCVKSTTFNIDVQLWNNPMSGVDIYAFDFVLTWFPGITLTKAVYHSPWAHFFEIANSTTGMTYHLALTAMPPSTGLFTVDQSVLTLTFHIDTDPCWPNTVTGAFVLSAVKMSSDGTVPVPIANMEIDNGDFIQYSVQPNIELTSTAANATGWIIQKCDSKTFDVEVDLTNVTNVYGFNVVISYDPTHLETDVQKITFKAAFPPPYESLSVLVTPGQIDISLMRPSEKPGVCGAIVPAVDIIFHTKDAVLDTLIPVPSITPISIDYAIILAKCPQLTTYGTPGSGAMYVLAYWTGLTYYFKPSAFDLNLDCTVDEQDLKVLLPFYGTTTAAGGYGDLYNDGAQLVDIFDFVAIAKKFGPVDP